ncbi:MAG: DEAD/DEAH box helicase, partial [Sphingomonadaceae bacterium]|nr:DEAD/DEAH box helicase [Sphingomonadaceae bacterium]
ADPRWLLPLLCRRGHVSRSEIGAIRITANESLFEVPGAVGARFLAAVRRTAGGDDDGVEIVPVEGGPPSEGRRPARAQAPAGRGGDRSGPPRDRNFKHRKGPRKA